MKIDLAQTIIKLNPTAQVSITNENYETIVWNDTPVIPENIILAKKIELQEIEDNRIEQEKVNKQSALNKLKALGLNDAEIKAIIRN
jgi:hypothetical protein